MTTIEDIFYRSGDVFLPKAVRDLLERGIYLDDKQAIYVNGWTGIHFLSGYIAGVVYMKIGKPLENYYWNLFIIHTIWEIWQVFIGMAKPWRLEGASNLIDTIIDTLAFMIGAYLAKTIIISRKKIR